MGMFCVTSNIASKPETSGSFFDYFDPLDIDSTVAAIERRIVDRAYPARRDAAIGRCGLLRRVQPATMRRKFVMRTAGGSRMP